MKARIIAGIFLAIPAIAFAAGDGMPLTSNTGTDYRDLLLKAMDTKDGKVTADVTGKTAEMIRQQINRPNARVVAEVTTIERLPQDGCKRFNIRFTTPGTLLPMTDGSSQMLDMSMKLNMCRNGFPPGTDNEMELNEKMMKANAEAHSRPAQASFGEMPAQQQKIQKSKPR